MNKKEYIKPLIFELSACNTLAAKQTTSPIEGQNPGGNVDPKFGVS